MARHDRLQLGMFVDRLGDCVSSSYGQLFYHGVYQILSKDQKLDK